MRGGRPLRFLAFSLGGWTVIRIAVLLPNARPDARAGDRAAFDAFMVPAIMKVVLPDAVATAFAPATHIATTDATRRIAPPHITPRPPSRPPSPAPSASAFPTRHPHGAMSVVAALSTPVATEPPVTAIIPVPSPAAPPAAQRAGRRLNGSAWLLARGGPAGTLSAGQLGASQGGVRLTYALGDRRKMALAARLAAPLTGRGREAALGIEWQPTALPVRLIAERRFVLDGGRGGPTLGVIAGYGPADIARNVRLEAYGQAGAIARNGVKGFVDASARVTHPVGRVAGARIDLGAGIWGSAQRAAERLDTGPSLLVGVPVADGSLRLALDWRHRVAGGARPGSGPAVSIGSDF